VPDVDVVVAGGGPAGLQFAREVATRSNYSVLVLEANDALTDNDKSSGGTFGDLIEGFDVPADVLMDQPSGITFEAPGASTTLPIPCYVLDFPALLAFLGRDAETAGARIETGARVREPVVSDGRVRGVTYRSDEGSRQVTADVVVDATGPAGTLVSELGLYDPDAAPLAVGKEYEVTGRYSMDSLLFRLDHEFAPGGYAWTFPAGEDVYRAGVCWFVDEYESRADGATPIDEYVRAWLSADDRWDHDEVRAVHAGKAGIDGSVNRRATDGLVAVGDAVASINPLLGEGIRPGMESARVAANVVLGALNAGDVSRERLAAYEHRWNAENGHRYRLQRLVGNLLYEFDADQQRRFVENADRLSAAQLDRFERYEPTVGDLLELYPYALQDVRKLPTLLSYVVDTATDRLVE
jgi:digeranylgeranylglycerophospholipid reductase